MPVFPGQLRYIHKNLFHTVFVLDPASICGLEAIDMIISLYENSFPMRFGVILYSTKFIKKIESNSGELPLDPVKNDSGTEEDVSSLGNSNQMGKKSC
ncbi:UDP-glucose:glycoprotein glucosyltransferase-like [Cornus florida]|uniref:UDP-glucose:glycoprotein glucosyltransferase-like n=1 Tax=Cornus florida TaxID=4283 RepID=UPI0028A02B93|nr:UDP-glucose:glycoprotein glucosyltransferase-like [Cornus florida]